MTQVNIELLDGKIIGITEYKFTTKRGEVKIYNHEVYIEAETNRDSMTEKVQLATRQEGDYSKSLNLANVLALILKIKEEKVTFEGFLNLCRSRDGELNWRGDIELAVSCNWGF